MSKTALMAAVLVVAACSRDIQNSEAVRQGVIDYLKANAAKTGLDVNLLEVDVGTVAFERTQARAAVLIRAKSSQGAGGMQMNYVLSRKGDHWVVTGRTESAGSPHGAGAMPPGQTLPPGHPPTGAHP